MDLNDLKDKEVPELHKLLLTHALDGRPVRICQYPPEFERDNDYMVIIEHEDGKHHCEFHMKAQDFDELLMDFEGFRTRIALPIMHNLDSVAYPERWERLNHYRLAELMMEHRSG